MADALAEFLRDAPPEQRVWPGTWAERSSEMLRRDLERVAIAYEVEGPDGPLFASFHCLRHSYVHLLDQSGVSLKQAMQLARHSDPKLTAARYGRAGLGDLAVAVDKLPSLLQAPSRPETGVLSATGTNGGQRLDRALTAPVTDDAPTMSVPDEACDDTETAKSFRKSLGILAMTRNESECNTLKKLPPAGFEPATIGLGKHTGAPQKGEKNQCFMRFAGSLAVLAE